jgi:hypothetical protein
MMAPVFVQAARQLQPGVRLAKVNTEQLFFQQPAVFYPLATVVAFFEFYPLIFRVFVGTHLCAIFISAAECFSMSTAECLRLKPFLKMPNLKR